MAFSVVEEYFSGQGVCMIGARDAAGKPAGLRPLGNVSALGIKNATTTLEHKESQTGQRGTDLRLTTEVKVNLDMTIENFNSANLALCTRGSATAVTGATVTAEAINGYPGLVTPLAHIKVSSVVVKLAATVLTPYVDDVTDWDYKLNSEAGSLLFNTATGMTASGAPTNIVYTSGVAALTVDYTYATQSRVDAFTQASPELYMRFEGLNTAKDNKPVVIEVFKFSTDPTQDLSMISDTVQSFVMSGSVLKDSLQGSGSQYYRVTKIDEV